jgi:hypothetical protein
MSTTSRVRIQRDERGWYTVVDEETGITVEGASKPDALETLTATLRRLDELPERDTADLPADDGYDELSERVQARFEDRDITEGDIEDAIEWARRE